MQRAKTFFVVCAGLLLLALAYHLGARNAEGQSASTLLAMTDYPRVENAAVAVDKAGAIYYGHLQQWSRVGTTPSAPVDAWTRNSNGEVFIALENGDLYRLESDWTLTYDSNVFPGSTPVQRSSFGNVKMRYR